MTISKNLQFLGQNPIPCFEERTVTLKNTTY